MQSIPLRRGKLFSQPSEQYQPLHKLTMENELDGQLFFIDILLIREKMARSTLLYIARPPTQISICAFTPTTLYLQQKSSCEDADVHSGDPLCIRSESCSEREACVAGPPGKWIPQGIHTEVKLPAV